MEEAESVRNFSLNVIGNEKLTELKRTSGVPPETTLTKVELKYESYNKFYSNGERAIFAMLGRRGIFEPLGIAVYEKPIPDGDAVPIPARQLAVATLSIGSLRTGLKNSVVSDPRSLSLGCDGIFTAYAFPFRISIASRDFGARILAEVRWSRRLGTDSILPTCIVEERDSAETKEHVIYRTVSRQETGRMILEDFKRLLNARDG